MFIKYCYLVSLGYVLHCVVVCCACAVLAGVWLAGVCGLCCSGVVSLVGLDW